MRIFVILFFVVNLTACLSLSIPNQTNPPVTSGHKVLSISAVGSTGPPIDFIPPGQESGGGELVPPMPAGFRFGYGVIDKIDIESELTAASVPDFYASLGVRYQWLGESAFKIKPNDWTSTAQLKFIYATGGESREDYLYVRDEDKSFDRYLNGFGDLYSFSLSNSFGHVISDWFVVYGGAKVIYLSAEYNVNIEAEEQRRPPRVEDKVEGKTAESITRSKEEIDDKLWIYGPFAGIQLQTTGPHWRIIFALEGTLLNLPIATGWYKGEERHWQPNVAASLNILLPF